MTPLTRLTLAIALVIGAIVSSSSAKDTTVAAIDVRTENLNAKNLTDNWLSYNGDYSGRRYTSLSEITTANVGQLRAQWVFHSHAPGILEVTPVVVNGVMFITASNDAFALDGRTGRVIWHHARPVSEGLIDDAAGHIN